jgi:type II secretory pathway pseudopilin PulG
MIHFSCQHCRAGLKAENHNIGRAIRCPQCRTVIEVPRSQGALVPLDTALPVSESEYLDTPRSQLPMLQEPVHLPAESNEGVSGGLPYSYDEPVVPKSTVMTTFILSVIGVLGIVMVIALLVILNARRDAEKALAAQNAAKASRKASPRISSQSPETEPNKKSPEKWIDPPIDARPGKGPDDEEAKKGRRPEEEEEDGWPKLTRKPTLRPSPPPWEEPPRKITGAEIDHDHEIVVQYVKGQGIAQNGLREPQWKGPWRATGDTKEGKLYRLVGLKTVPTIYRDQDENILVTYYFFLRDDLVVKHQGGRGPLDLERVTICKPLDPEPLLPPDSPGPGEAPPGEKGTDAQDAVAFAKAVRHDAAMVQKKIANEQNAAKRGLAEMEFASRYQGKVQRIRGVIHSVVANSVNNVLTRVYVVRLFSRYDRTESIISCHFGPDQAEALAKLKRGQSTTIEGQCSGLALTVREITFVGCRLVAEE